MKGRKPIPRLSDVDLPVDLEPEVEAVLEIDRLFWIDHPQQLVMERRLVPGEELPYKVPAGFDKDNRPLTIVQVHRWGRTFVVQGTPVLHIVDRPENQKAKKKDPKARNAKKPYQKPQLAEFRAFLANKQQRKEAVKLSSEELTMLAEKERDRQRELQQLKQEHRQSIRATKEARRVSSSVRR